MMKLESEVEWSDGTMQDWMESKEITRSWLAALGSRVHSRLAMGPGRGKMKPGWLSYRTLGRQFPLAREASG